MSAKTEMVRASTSAASPPPPSKPSIAMGIATVCGIGYIPMGPGTWGSVAGVLIYILLQRLANPAVYSRWWAGVIAPIVILIAAAGVWAADRTGKFLNTKDPQCVVVDEVSGQFLTYAAAFSPLNWKYLLLGFILFRAFDIWKPFPARQAESLPGGLGIMADDWMAGVYAAMGLWIARAAGL